MSPQSPFRLFNPVGAAGGQKLVSQGWGTHPEWYKTWGIKGHNGIDLAVPVGTPVRCAGATEGKVVVSKQHTDHLKENRAPLGTHIIIEHEPCEDFPGGYQTLYAHLNLQDVFAGNRVSPGQHIGTSGNTGNSTGPHLHFGLRPLPYDHDDGWLGFVDPQSWISWDHDPFPAYVSRYNPYRKVQGLPELEPEEPVTKYGPGEYGKLSASQAERDRTQVALPVQTETPNPEPEPAPASKLKQITDRLEAQDDDGEGTVIVKRVVGGIGKAGARGSVWLAVMHAVIQIWTGGETGLWKAVQTVLAVTGTAATLAATPVATVPAPAPIPVPPAIQIVEPTATPIPTPIVVQTLPTPIVPTPVTHNAECRHTALGNFWIRPEPRTDSFYPDRRATQPGETYCLVRRIDRDDGPWVQLEGLGWVRLTDGAQRSFDLPAALPAG